MFTGEFRELELDPSSPTIAGQFCMHPRVSDELAAQIIVPAARALATGSVSHAQAVAWVATKCNDLNELSFCLYNLRAVAAHYSNSWREVAMAAKQ